VDFETFRDTYRCDRVAVVAERGAVSMTRGLLHLLLYRFVYHVGVLAASDVHNAIDLTRFLVSNFGLYLRISGLFHLAVGILQLYGFDLPLTHYRYFLATGMNDFWRRVNIYWKDFMLKVFFYPAYFRLRRWPQRYALALATVCVVIVTWALHIYQRFWVTGRFAFIWQDAAFWGVLGVAMIGSTVFESRRTRLRGVRRRTWTAGKAWRQAIEIVLTFTGITVLWSLWTCSSFAEWKGMWVAGAAMNAATRHRLSAGALAVAVALVACVMLPRPVFVSRMAAAFSRVRQTAHARTWAAAARVGALVLLLLLVRPAVYLPLGGQTAAIIHSVRNAGMNAVDAQRAREGYYEELLDTHHLGSHLAEVQALKPRNWNAVHTSRGAAAPLNYELIPSLHVTLNAAELRTNRWGMRDGDYARDKPPGVLRIAVLGSSVTMGAGVEDKETYEALLEADLRRDGMRVESLNFAVFGYSALQNLIVLETKVLPFHPDVLLYATHDIEEALLVRNLVPVVGQPLRDTYPELRTVIEQAGVVGASPAVARWRLTPYAPRLLAWAFQRMVAVCRQHGIAPLAVFIPTLARGADGFDAAPSLRPLAEAGFETIDLSDVFSGYDAERLQLAPWDEHPNALGHRLIADRLHQELVPPESVLQRVYAHVASGAEAHANDVRNE